MRKKRKYILRRIIVMSAICIFLMGFLMMPIENATSQVTSGNIEESGKIIIISLIGIIAFAMIFIGVGVNKNILKK